MEWNGMYETKYLSPASFYLLFQMLERARSGSRELEMRMGMGMLFVFVIGCSLPQVLKK